jgi:hypothetical protein
MHQPRIKNINITWIPEPIIMESDMDIMPSEAISTVYFINHSYQQ